MKKTLVAALLGLAATASVLAQGKIIVYNYGANPVKYGSDVNAQLSTGTGNIANGSPAATTWTFALYGVASGNATTINGLFAGDGGYGLVAGVGGLVLGTGTAGITGDGQFGNPQLPTPTTSTFAFSGAGAFVLVAYNGADYASSSIRGHSAAFSETAFAAPASPDDLTGGQFGNFSVHLVPEPSTFALAGLGLASLLIFRRRK